MKVKLFTHTDLDGIGCAILAINAFEKENVDIEYCNYDDINQKVSDFLLTRKFEDYNNVFITDISVNEGTANLIEEISSSNPKYTWMFNLLDHHDTSSWLNKYEWADVNSKIPSDEYTTFYNMGSKSCGTMMFYQWLLECFRNDDEKWYIDSDNVHKLVEHIRQYDTWEWQDVYKSEKPKQLNDLFYIYGKEEFIKRMLLYIGSDNALFSDTDTILLKLNQEKIDKYIESKQKQLMIKEVLGYKAGVIFAEQYHSEVGNVLATNNPGLDFIVLINTSYSVSYRSVKDGIDLGKDVAKVFGGGGHPKAAGSQISDEIKQKMIELILQ